MKQCKSLIFLVYIRRSKFNQSAWRISITWSKLTNHKARKFKIRNFPKNRQIMEYPAIWLVGFAFIKKKKLKCKFLKIIFLLPLPPPFSLCDHPSFHSDHPPRVSLPYPPSLSGAIALLVNLPVITFLLLPFRLVSLSSASSYFPTFCQSDHITTCARGSSCASQDLPHLPHVPARFLSICSSQDLSPRYLTLLASTLPQVPARLLSSSCSLWTLFLYHGFDLGISRTIV